tara:strand:+ start:895 stop:2589 length:1695 start_codon:yes stop_codon:yes gene_type:complete
MKSNGNHKLDGFLSYIIRFIKNTSKELSPSTNIKSLHTNIQSDIIAGIMVAIVALPLALAFGEISQLGPKAGIWSAIIGGIIGGFFGGSMVGVSGPTAPMASQIAAFMGAFVIGNTEQPDLVAAFSIIFLSGLILVCISTLKISRVVHYIPYSIIAGFMCGIGVIIILTQINAFIGLESEKNIHSVFQNFSYNMQNVNYQALYVAIPSLIVLFLWDFIKNKVRFLVNIPAPLIALVIGSCIAYFMDLNITYIGDRMNISDDSKIFTLYFPDFSRITEFFIPAIGLAGLAVIDSLLSCKVADNMTGTKHSSDRETFGQGMANMVSGLFGGISTATATTQTVGNITFGAKTPLATIVKGLTLLAVLLGLSNLVAAIPNACLAAILFKLGTEILDYRILPILRKLPITDLLVFMIVLFITVYQNLLIAVLVGVIFIILVSIREIKSVISSKYEYKVHSLSNSELKKNNKSGDDVSAIVLEPSGPLFFGSIVSFIKFYNNIPDHEVLIFDMKYVTMLDISGIYAIEDIIKIEEKNNNLVLVYNANDSIRKILNKVSFIGNIKKGDYKK